MRSRADEIADWNEKAVNSGNTARVGNFPTARAIAMVHLAMFEALNSIEPRYTPYRAGYRRTLTRRARPAAASAAHAVLVRVYSLTKLRNWIKRCKRRSPLSRMVLSRPKAFRSANRRAQRYYADRRDDGSDAPNSYRPFTVAGKYVPTVFPIGSSAGGR